MDCRLALMCGIDIPVPELQVSIHQPRIKEIAYLGEQDFFIAIQCLNVNKDLLREGNILLANVTNFQVFMMIMQEKEMFDKRIAVEQLLQLMFPTKSVMFTPRSIMLSDNDISVMIDENNFESFQEAIRKIFCVSNKNNQQAGFNPANKKAQEIAQKLMRGRQRVAEQNGSANASIFSQYLSVLAIGTSMSLEKLMDLTMYQVYDLIERYQLYLSWDIDIRSRLAGASIDDKPDNWMKSIHS